jgi:hypothetical protein
MSTSECKSGVSLLHRRTTIKLQLKTVNNTFCFATIDKVFYYVASVVSTEAT